MPRVSAIEILPTAIKTELKTRLSGSGYGDLVKHSAWLKKQGHSVSKSALGRFAQSLKGRTKVASEFVARLGAVSSGTQLASEEVVDLLLEMGTLEIRKAAITARLNDLKFSPDLSGIKKTA